LFVNKELLKKRSSLTVIPCPPCRRPATPAPRVTSRNSNTTRITCSTRSATGSVIEVQARSSPSVGAANRGAVREAAKEGRGAKYNSRAVKRTRR
jgi:hypothetical protein